MYMTDMMNELRDKMEGSVFKGDSYDGSVRIALWGTGEPVAVSVSGPWPDEVREALARGIEELFLTADDAAAGFDAFATAAELAKLAEAAGGFDAIVVGDGSADLYAKQTGVQLAATLDVPYVSAVVEAKAEGGLQAKLQSVRKYGRGQRPGQVIAESRQESFEFFGTRFREMSGHEGQLLEQDGTVAFTDQGTGIPE